MTSGKRDNVDEGISTNVLFEQRRGKRAKRIKGQRTKALLL